MILFILGGLIVAGTIAGGVVLALWLIGQEKDDTAPDLKHLLSSCPGCNKPVLVGAHKRSLKQLVFRWPIADTIPTALREPLEQVYDAAEKEINNRAVLKLVPALMFQWSSPMTYTVQGYFAIIPGYSCVSASNYKNSQIWDHGAEQCMSSIAQADHLAVVDSYHDLLSVVIESGVITNASPLGLQETLLTEPKYKRIEYRINLDLSVLSDETPMFQEIKVSEDSIILLLHLFAKQIDYFVGEERLLSRLAEQLYYAHDTIFSVYTNYSEQEIKPVVTIVENYIGRWLGMEGPVAVVLVPSASSTAYKSSVMNMRLGSVPENLNLARMKPSQLEAIQDELPSQLVYASIKSTLGRLAEADLTETSDSTIGDIGGVSEPIRKATRPTKHKVKRSQRNELKVAKWLRFAKRAKDDMNSLLSVRLLDMDLQQYTRLRRYVHTLKKCQPDWDITKRLTQHLQPMLDEITVIGGYVTDLGSVPSSIMYQRVQLFLSRVQLWKINFDTEPVLVWLERHKRFAGAQQ